VRRLLEALSLYPDRKDLKTEYPEVDEEDIKQALSYAAREADDRILMLGGINK
jgi:uncharacterized protein (DUF433 family)